MKVHKCIPALLLTLLTGCGLAPPAQPAPVPVSTPAPGAVSTVIDALGEPRPEDTGAHYDRDAWGDWATGDNGCTTRELVLRRDGRQVTVDDSCRPSCPTEACWTSPYDGVAVSDARELQIDHIVPVAEANRSGARHWSAEQRQAFYNDPDNLVAVSKAANSQKSDDDPAEWRPADSYACQYATTYATVKTKYGLAADADEVAALRAMATACPAS
ncbi:HNH endonuclease family protein [Actinokineospora pegani]|uniref:HNH endonuclease family protein n=1 Tax=Actinokineospora pegani TaxID=2654637 RepID=UPI0018D32E3C|nr:HNH endonuclease family protein [Actinokineospora pegani]